MVRHCRRNLALFLILFCSMVLIKFPADVIAADAKGNFSGTWTANGTRENLSLGKDRETALIKFSGHVNLKDTLGQQKDYWSTCIGLADSKTGSDVRCVWRSLDGQEIYIVLQAEQLSKDWGVTGEIVGGTGGAKGITGSLSFKWSTLSFQKNNNSIEIGGYTKELKGVYQLP